MSSTYRELTVTLYDELEENLRVFLGSSGRRSSSSSNELPTEQSKHLRCHQGVHLTITGDRRLRQQRRSQDFVSRVGEICLTVRQVSTTGLHFSTLASAQKRKRRTWRRVVSSLVGWSVRNYRTIGNRRPGSPVHQRRGCWCS